MKPYGFSTSYYEAKSTDEEPGLYFMRDFHGNIAKFHLCISEAADSYELYLEEPDEPKDELIAILKGAGFEEKEGWLTKDVERSDIQAKCSRSLARLRRKRNGAARAGS